MLTFAIIPAAGVSARMGTNKLFLPWGSTTVIEHVLAAWRQSRVDHVFVVVRPDDRELPRLARGSDAEVVVPRSPPREMRESVAIALRHIQSQHRPSERDAWMLAPADMPGLTPTIIDHVLDAHSEHDPAILVPEIDGKSGHPVLFPWSLQGLVDELPPGQGVRALLDTHRVRRVPCESPAIFADLDTPADYERLRATALDRRHDTP